MSKFYLPYQFIPTTGRINGDQQKTSYEAIKQGAVDPAARHDLWMPEMHSGRIVCKLRLETPTFVGAAHTNEKPANVHPYKWNRRSAIPGNSLRGMIGSLIETLSQSALRVLEDQRYSVRKRGEDAISAVGMLRKSGATFDILPLTLPIESGNSVFVFDTKWVQVFEGVPLEECLPAYVPGYDTSGETVEYCSLLESCAGKCSGPGEGQRFHALLSGTLTGTVTEEIKVDPVIHDRSRNCYLSVRNLTDIRKNGGLGYLPGYLQILELSGRPSGPLRRKKYALFVPEPRKGRRALSVPDPVLDNFKRVIEERWRDSNEDFPIFPKDYPPPNAQGEWRPLDKMLVFFDIDYLNGDLVVTELSFSAIWREAVQPSAWNLFYALGRNNGIGRDLLPWHGERTDLTPAERLLGAVEEERGEQARCPSPRACASPMPSSIWKSQKTHCDSKPLRSRSWQARNRHARPCTYTWKAMRRSTATCRNRR